MVALAASAGGSDEHIPGYRILGKLGKGATTTVYKARQISTNRLVAIKVLPKSLSESSDFIERFVARANSASQIHHENILQTIDVGQTPDGFTYLVVEYVEAPTLYDLINPRPLGAGHIFSEADALDISIQIADALAHIHQHGLIYREVKPKNILLMNTGVAKLADLDVARPVNDKEAALTQRGMAYGIPYYISPEQIRGDADIDARTDIYSLCASMYHLLTGRPPFDGETPTTVMYKHLKAELIPAHHFNNTVHESVSRIIQVAMSKDKEVRYQSMTMMLKEMRDCRGKS